MSEMLKCKRARLRIEEIGKYSVRAERKFFFLNFQQMVNTANDALERINFSLNIFRPYQFIIHFFLMHIHNFIYIKNKYFAWL